MSTPLLYTTRDELDGIMHVIEGHLPADLHGVFYVAYPVGSVNSGGLPFKEFNEDGSENGEYGTPIMNGDGMVMKVDFNDPQGPTLKTRLMKTPCYYADYYSSRQFPENHEFFRFENFGISRISMVLGARNELNTALIPVRFPGESTASLLATYDVGRPFLVDADSLNLVTPVGTLDEWINAQPGEIPWPFGVVQSTAHPAFDPLTRELFTVNYKRDSSSFVTMNRAIFHLKNNRESFRQRLENLSEELIGTDHMPTLLGKIKRFFLRIGDLIEGDKWQEREDEEAGNVKLALLKWTGSQNIQKWFVTDDDGEPLQIHECMHQMGLTRDYLILTDCSFKFALDLMTINPFPNSPKIDTFLRWVFSKPMAPFTTTYIIKRADLKEGVTHVKAIQLDKPIPLETIHYSLNYENPDGKCTLFGVHNAANCLAEWLRPYDTNALTGEPIDPEVIGLFAIGGMDITRFGKWVFDAEKGKLLEDESQIWESMGKPDEPNIGPNTWELALYTYRDMLSSENVTGEIRYLWCISNGTDRRMLSSFIHNLYKKYPNRKLSVKDIEYYTAKSLPFGLTRLNCQTMQPEDYYQLPTDWYLRGAQFVPKSTPTPGVDSQLDGYLVGTAQINTRQGQGDWERSSEVWVFDAADVAKGPVCRLTHPQLHYCFTIHTLWIPEAKPCTGVSVIDIEKEYTDLINHFDIPDGALIQPFLEANVYPHFKLPQ